MTALHLDLVIRNLEILLRQKQNKQKSDASEEKILQFRAQCAGCRFAGVAFISTGKV